MAINSVACACLGDDHPPLLDCRTRLIEYLRKSAQPAQPARSPLHVLDLVSHKTSFLSVHPVRFIQIAIYISLALRSGLDFSVMRVQICR